MSAQNQQKNHPQWFTNLCSFTPRFPGDGFNHTFTAAAAMPTFQEFSLICPCGTVTIINGCVIRTEGQSDVVICPTCRSWHSVLWRVPAPVIPKGGFIIAGKNKHG